MTTQTNPTGAPPKIVQGWLNLETWQDLATLATVASADDSRPIINNVLLWTENGNLEGVATDSYKLAHMIASNRTEDNFEPDTFAIAAKDLTASAKWMKDTKSRTFKATLTADSLTLETVDERTVTYPRQDHSKYPAWRQLIPAYLTSDQPYTMTDSRAFSFNPHLLAGVAKVAPWNDKRANVTATLSHEDGNRVIAITGENSGRTKTTFLFMPVRYGNR